MVVPVYNVEKYLVKCLESLKRQTFSDIEVICIDDGSTDGSGRILDEFAEKDERFTVIHKNNTGYGHSVNIGLSKAKGKYIGILESDDIAKDNMVEMLYCAAIQSEADVIKGNFDLYFENSKEQLRFNEILNECPYNRKFKAYENPKIFETPASIWSGLYKRTFLRDKKIFFLETPGASYQDVSFAFKVLMYADSIYCIEESVLNYRYDNPDSSVRNPGKIFCICDEYKEIEKAIKKELLTERKKLLTQKMLLIKFRAYIWNFNRLAIPYQYYFLETFSNEFKTLCVEEQLDISEWSIEEKELFYLIIENKDSFFSRYAKEYQDVQLNNIKLINDTFEFDGFIDSIAKHRNIYIYGAGVIGTEVWKFISSTHNRTKVKSYIISDGEKKHNTKLGLEVKYLSEVEDKNALILVAIKHNNRPNVIKLLVENGFSNILVITDRMRQYM